MLADSVRDENEEAEKGLLKHRKESNSIMNNTNIKIPKFIDNCGITILSLVIGFFLGARFSLPGTDNKSPNFDFFDYSCDKDIDRYDQTFCYAHDYTLTGSQMEFLEGWKTNFLVLGDWGRNGHCCQNDVALEMSRIDNISFIINTGDNFYENGLNSVEDSRIQTSWLEVYRQRQLLNIPWYSILGNHDYRSNIKLEISMTEKYEAWYLPSRNYFKVINQHILLVFIDTTPVVNSYRTGGDDDVKPYLPDTDIMFEREFLLSFLNKTFGMFESDSAIRWRIVVGHHPIVTVGEHYGQDDDTGFLEDVLAANFVANKVHAYFSGHDHNLQHMEYKSLNLFISGAGSKIRGFPTNKGNFTTYAVNRDDKPIARFHIGQQGYIGVSASDKFLLVQFFNLRGAWMYSKIVSTDS